MNSAPLKSKLAALVVGALSFIPAAWSAEALITFGSGSPTAGKCKTAGPNASVPTLTENKDSVLLSTPNWWSSLVQYEHFKPVSLAAIQPGDFLTLTLKGAPSGSSPKLLVLLFTPDWQQKAQFSFDLSSVKPDQFTTIKADVAFGKAVPAGNGLLTTGVGVIQLATRGTDNLEWSLEIQSIGVVRDEAKK